MKNKLLLTGVMLAHLGMEARNTVSPLKTNLPHAWSGHKEMQVEKVFTGGEEPVMTEEVTLTLKKKINGLPVYSALNSTRTDFDWLLTPQKSRADIYATADGKGVVVANAMVSRTFRLFPNLATTDFVNRMTGESMLRAVSSEGTVSINGHNHSIGGLAGQPERAYIKDEWIDRMVAIPGSFICAGRRNKATSYICANPMPGTGTASCT